MNHPLSSLKSIEKSLDISFNSELIIFQPLLRKVSSIEEEEEVRDNSQREMKEFKTLRFEKRVKTVKRTVKNTEIVASFPLNQIAVTRIVDYFFLVDFH